MKRVLTLTLAVLAALCVPALAAEPLAEDRTTHGEWVGKYGKDGYVIFNDASHGFSEKLPEYVQELTYMDLYEGTASPHAWWNGTDGSDLEDPAHAADALWTDETKTARVGGCIYNGDGLTITVDTGDVTTNVSLYSLDWDNNGRIMVVTQYDADGNEVVSKEVGEFLNGVYLTSEVTGKATFEFLYLDATNMDSPSNAVVAGIFFDSVAGEVPETEAPETEAPETEAHETEAPETEPAVEVPETVETSAPVETAPEVVETVATAPQTFDAGVIAGIAAAVSACGYAISKKRR